MENTTNMIGKGNITLKEDYTSKKVTIERLQNEEAQQEYGFDFHVGQECWLTVMGKVESHHGGYVLTDDDGERLRVSFPMAYCKDEDGKRYMIELVRAGVCGLFEERD